MTMDSDFTTAGSRVMVLGMLAGRDAATAAEAISDIRPDLVVCTTVDGDRGLPAGELARAVAAAGMPVEVESDPQRAIERVLRLAEDDDTVVVTGSFRLLAAARAVVERHLSGPVR